MKCDNCGAPMRKPPGADYFVCDYCFSFKYPDLVRYSEGIISLEESSDYKCPTCAVNLKKGKVAGKEVFYCERCKGMLLTMKDFSSVIEFERSKHPNKIPSLKKITEEELSRQIHCPVCSGPMDTHPYYGPGRIVVDTCSNCYVIWLDAGELSVIVSSI